MEAEGGESSKKAPAIASSARRRESTPAPASTTLALALVHPAPQEQAASRSPPSSVFYVPQDAMFDAAGSREASDWAGFHEGGGGFVFSSPAPLETHRDVASRSRAPHSTSTMPRFQAGPSSAAIHAATGSPRVATSDPDVPLQVVVSGDGSDPSASADDGDKETRLEATGSLDWAGFHKSGKGFVFTPPPLETLREDAQDKPARESGGLVSARSERGLEALPETFTETRLSDLVWTPVLQPLASASSATGCLLLADPRALRRGRWCRGVNQRRTPAGITMIRTGEELRRATLERAGLLLPRRQDHLAHSPLRSQTLIAPHAATRPKLMPAPSPARMPTGTELLQAALERAGLLIEPPPQQSVRHPLALAPSRPDPDRSANNFVVIPREDVELGWAELQERRQEREELRWHTQALQQECWRLRHALDLIQTPVPHPHSSSGSLVSGGHRYGLCGDCFRRPAQMALAPRALFRVLPGAPHVPLLRLSA